MKKVRGWICILVAAWLAPAAAGQSEMEKAVARFKQQTGRLGMRSDSPTRQRGNSQAVRWRGRVYENFRNDFLDATPHEITQRGGSKPPLRRNQFGVNLTGPLVLPKLYNGRGRTFLSFSYEGVRDRVARSFLQTIPTAGERRGDFSGTVDQAGQPLIIRDPATTRINPAFNPHAPVSLSNLEYLRDPFPGNVIAASRIDPVAARTVAFYPLPNAAVGPFDRNNFFQVSPQLNYADGFILRVDHNAGERHRLTANFSYSKGLNTYAAQLPTPADPSPADRHFQDPSGSLEYVFSKSSRTVMSWRFYAATTIGSSGEERGPDYAEQIGLKGSSRLGFPRLDISPYTGLGRSYPRTKNAITDYRWNWSLSLRRQSHSISVSADFRMRQVTSFQPPYPAGRLSFDSGLTSLPGVTGTGHGFASFLLGLASYGEKSYTVSPSYFRSTWASFSLRDQYQLSPRLTWTWRAGLYVQTPRVEKYNRQSTVDLSVINPANGRPGAMIVAGHNGIGRAFQPVWVYPEAGAGLAWNPFGDLKTVVRLGYSMERSTPGVWATEFGTQAFNARPIFLSPNTQLEPAVRLLEGFPPLGRPLPDLRLEAANDTNADLIYRGGLLAFEQSASLSLEREVARGLVISVGASSSWIRDVLTGNWAVNLNALPLWTLEFRDRLYDEEFNRNLRPYPQYKSLNVGNMYPAGRYRSESFYLGAEKRTSGGLSLSLRLNWLKARDDYSGGRQDYFNRRNEWSLTGANPFTLSLTYMYELPFGRGKLLNFGDWRRHLLDGWSISGSSYFAAGEPIALRPQFNNTGGVITYLRVNAVPGIDPRVPKPSASLWFNPKAFDQPADFKLGNVSRRHPRLRNPCYQNHDISVSKRFTVGRDQTVEFSVLALNFLNHANWNDPDPVIGPARAPNVNAGKIIGSYGGRVMQLGLKYNF